VDTAKSSWVARAEAAIRSLRDVDGASIQADGESIREIHVVTRSSRAAKQIVRDVQTVLLTRLNRSIDFRVVSIAYLAPEPDPAASANGPTPGAQPAPPPPAPPRDVEPARGLEPAAQPAPPTSLPAAMTGGEAARRAGEERIRFGGVNLFVSGPRTQAQVELRWQGLPRLGSASGWSTRAGANRLIARATLQAVQEFLADEIAIGVQDLEILKLGRRRVVVVSLSLLVGRQEKVLVGSCVVEQDLHPAVVCATLAAVNRVVAQMRAKEPTEYLLRPTSA
jgi:hypothetical protein